MGAKICDQLAQGKSLTEICDQAGYPDRGTVRRWVSAQPDFRASYESSRLAWADELFEQIVTIADQARQIAEEADAREGNSNAAIAALREEIRAKMWVCARLRPDKYGDRVQLAGDPTNPLITSEMADPRALAIALHAAAAAAAKDAARTIEHQPAEPPAPGALHCVGIGQGSQPIVRHLAAPPPATASPSLLIGEAGPEPTDDIRRHAMRAADRVDKITQLPTSYRRGNR